MSLKIYLAGPIAGQTGDAVNVSIAEKSAVLIDFGFLVYHPMVGKESLILKSETFKPSGYEDFPIATNHAIFARDKWMVAQSDVILADLSNSGGRVSIGTMMEIAWANFLGKQIIVIMPFGNVHDHLFVREAATIIFGNMEEAYDYLRELSLSRMGLS
jgi:nucleoside 2-deoxyribosyltransferase